MHTAIGSFIWNKWTPAAVATGTEGVLTADYVTVDWNKVDYLSTIGLYPWYTLPTSHRTVSQKLHQLAVITSPKATGCNAHCHTIHLYDKLPLAS